MTLYKPQENQIQANEFGELEPNLGCLHKPKSNMNSQSMKLTEHKSS